MKKLEGKIAIITGASAGIGKASALLFASEGASLGLIDINPDGGKEVCEEIRKNEGNVEFFGIDVSNPEAIKMPLRRWRIPMEGSMCFTTMREEQRPGMIISSRCLWMSSIMPSG